MGVRLTKRRSSHPLSPGCTYGCCKALMGGEATETGVWRFGISKLAVIVVEYSNLLGHAITGLS